MPVILAPQEYGRWLEGSIEDVIAFQFRPPFPSERLLVDRTALKLGAFADPASSGARRP
jgi:hypothetical protein